jgi:hypothetical protein
MREVQLRARWVHQTLSSYFLMILGLANPQAIELKVLFEHQTSTASLRKACFLLMPMPQQQTALLPDMVFSLEDTHAVLGSSAS